MVTSVFLLDQQLRVTYLNAAAQTLLGLGCNQALGRSIAELTRGAESLLPMFDRVREGGEGVVQRELAWSAPGGVDRILDCAVTQVILGDKSARLLLEIEDITQHRRLTRENALLAQLGGSRLMVRQLAHEIKNPLGGLRGAAQLLERELLDPALREYTRVIISEADRLANLLDSMLGPGRPPSKQLINVHELLERVYHLLRSEAPERRHDRPGLRSQPSAVDARSESHHSGDAQSGPQRHSSARRRPRGFAAVDLENPRGQQCQRRRASPPAGCLDSIRGQRAGRAQRDSRNHFLSARFRPRRRVGIRTWDCSGSGQPSWWLDRIR